ncbi:MAG TPA: hypothetical protein PLD59_09060, partial [Tepidisphaeraceae bacterium]|nr:hypothetical protein [Tepidisphaeraceae bacterium]
MELLDENPKSALTSIMAGPAALGKVTGAGRLVISGGLAVPQSEPLEPRLLLAFANFSTSSGRAVAHLQPGDERRLVIDIG